MSTATEINNEILAQELQDLAEKVAQFQQAKDLSNNALLRKFPGLGSTKTYTRIAAGDLDQLDLERQAANYRAVVALIESIGEEADREEIYDDLTPVLQLRRVILETFKQTGNKRFVLMQGDTGLGKTCCRDVLVTRFGQRILTIEATECWSDSPMALLGSILAAFGVTDAPVNLMERLNMVIERLRKSRVCLVIDEGHHMGPRTLNTVKTLLNQTPGEFVILAMPTLWARIQRAAYEEVRQLTGNRLAERITLDGMRPKDVEKFISRRLPKNQIGEDMKAAIRMVLDRAPTRGNLAFLRDVCTRAAELGEGKPTMEHFAAAVSAEMEAR